MNFITKNNIEHAYMLASFANYRCFHKYRK